MAGHLCDRCRAAEGACTVDHYWMCARCGQAYIQKLKRESLRRVSLREMTGILREAGIAWPAKEEREMKRAG